MSSVSIELTNLHPLAAQYLGLQVHSDFWNEDFYHDFSRIPAEDYSFLKLFKRYSHNLLEKRGDRQIILSTPLDTLFWDQIISRARVLHIRGQKIPVPQPMEPVELLLEYINDKDILVFPDWQDSYLLSTNTDHYLLNNKGLALMFTPLNTDYLTRLFSQGSVVFEHNMKQNLYTEQAQEKSHLQKFMNIPEVAGFDSRRIVFQFNEEKGEYILDAYIVGTMGKKEYRLAIDFARFRQVILLGEALILHFDPQVIDVIQPHDEFYEHLKTVVQQSFASFYELLNEVEGNRIRTSDKEALFEKFLPGIQEFIELEKEGKQVHFTSQRLTEQRISLKEWEQAENAPIDWLQVEFLFKMGEHHFQIDEVQELLANGYLIKDDKLISLDAEDKDILETLFRGLDIQHINEKWQIRRFRIPQILDQDIKMELPSSLRDLPAELGKEKALIKIPIHKDLKKILRTYQQTGVYWLSFLNRFHFGGILADEMGLGKTLQVLTFLESIKGTGPALIVCPSSLVHNWAQEIDKFMDGRLSYVLIYGNKEKRQEKLAHLKEYDVAITSYHLTHLDKDMYEEINFTYCILDEAQHIKNKTAKRTRSIKGINSLHRVAITGTPMENNISELWSIFDFLMPGFLGSHKDFKNEFETPINGFDRNKSNESFQRLKKLIHPFILRRTKAMVYKELPPKIEQIITLDLSDQQKSLYLDTLSRVRNNYLPILEQKGVEASYLEFLAALTRLRQICLHPGLVYPEELEDQDPYEISVKLAALMELVEEVIDSGHRVLIFSQFVSMLKIIRREFHKNEIEYLYLDGKTRDRVGLVEHFNQSDIPVFLISLKAGGVGLNLTGANSVILFDPWWNPAVENQAIDRAHRIGQDKTVNVYRLVTKGTIEEKIFQLQSRKKQVFDQVLTTNESFIKKMNKDDILEIFKGMED